MSRAARRPPLRWAVIGAGMAGLACARRLADAGQRVTIFERGRSVGGRLATRSTPQGSFDLGAQYFTAQSHAFERVVDQWAAAGCIQPWAGRLVAIANGQRSAPTGSTRRFVALPGMQSLVDPLCRGLSVQLLTPIGELLDTPDGWRLIDTAGAPVGLAAFDVVLVAVPSPGAAPLLRGISPLAEQAAAVQWSACWATALALGAPAGLGFEGAFVNDDPILSWIARDDTKPGRAPVAGVAERWVLHARPAWSDDYRTLDEEAVVHWMVRSFAARVGSPLNVLRATAVLWPWAVPVTPLAAPCLWDGVRRIGVAGDWCGGPRVEGAWASGDALAARALADLVDTVVAG